MNAPFSLACTAAAVVLCGLAACSRVGGPAATGADSARPTPTPYRVLQDRPDRLIVELPNRMVVVAQEMHAAPVVSAQVWVKTGSIYEQEHVGAGLSHFLEHLLSGGSTRNRTEDQSKQILGRIGAQTNAATSLDTVQYYINTTRPHAATAIELLSDWMQNSLITQEEYARERDVIQREFEMGMGEPGRILWKHTQAARFTAHPARHPTIGYLDEFLKITRQEIHAFYRRMYVPNNMVFVVSGDIDRRQAVEQVAALWKDARAGDLPTIQFPEEPAQDGPREARGTADIRGPRLRLAWPGTRLAGEDDYALDLLAVILGQGESSRLVQGVRDQQQRVTAISAYNLSFTWGKGFFGIDAETAAQARPGEPAGPENLLAQARDAILEELRQLVRKGVTAAELERAKRQVLAQVILDAQTVEDQASRLAGDLIGMGDPDYLTRYARAIPAVTAAQVRAAAEKYLVDQRRITITLLPKTAGDPPEAMTRPAEVPEAAGFPRRTVDLDNRVLLDRVRATLQAPLAGSGPAVVEPVKRYVLDNGLRVLIGRSTVTPAVAMQMYSLGGLLAEEAGKEGVAYAAAAMQTRGTTTRSAQQLARAVEDLGASLECASGSNTGYVSGLCLKADWPRLLELLADVTLNPTFPEEEWARLQKRLEAVIDRQRDSWNGELRQAFLPAFFGKHPWASTPPGRREVVAALTADDLRRFHRDHLAAAQTVLAIYGDVQPEEVIAQVRRALGSLPRHPARAFQPADPPAPVEALKVLATQKPLAAVQIGLGPGVRRTDPDYATVRVLARLLSDFPAGWLDNALRGEGPGLVYAVGAGEMAGMVPGYFTVLFNTDPARLPEALGRTRAVLDRARDQDAGAEDLARAKAAVLTAEFLGKQTNGDRATEAALAELYGLPADETERFLAEVQKLDAAAVRRAAGRYLRNPVTVILSNQPVPEEQLKAK